MRKSQKCNYDLIDFTAVGGLYSTMFRTINPFKSSDSKWLQFKVFMATVVVVVLLKMSERRLKDFYVQILHNKM